MAEAQLALRTDGTELETVAGEGERRCAVAVGIVNHQLGNLGITPSFMPFLAGKSDRARPCRHSRFC